MTNTRKIAATKYSSAQGRTVDIEWTLTNCRDLGDWGFTGKRNGRTYKVNTKTGVVSTTHNRGRTVAVDARVITHASTTVQGLASAHNIRGGSL